MKSKQTMTIGCEAMAFHKALQLWHRIPKWIVYLIILIVPGALPVAIALRLARDRRNDAALYLSEGNRRSAGDAPDCTCAMRSDADAGSIRFGIAPHFYGF